MTGAPSRQDGQSPIVCSYSLTAMVAKEVLRWSFLSFGLTTAGSKEVVLRIQDENAANEVLRWTALGFVAEGSKKVVRWIDEDMIVATGR